MWANTTIGVEADLPLRSSASQASCSSPRVPRPPAFRLTTFTRPTKGTPSWSKLYEPRPLAICHEPHEVHAVLVEAVPAGALGVLAVALAVELDLLVDDVVFARHVVHV